MSRLPERSSGLFEFQQYRIKTFTQPGKATARAFIGDVPMQIVSNAKTEQDAVRAVEQQLVARDTARLAQRLNGIPCASEYADAFAALGSKVTKKHWKILQAHMDAPDATMTADAIAQTAGYANYRATSLHYGKLGRLVADQLHFVPSPFADGTTCWTSVLAEAGDNTGLPEGKWTWKLRPQMVEWLRARPPEIVQAVSASGNL